MDGKSVIAIGQRWTSDAEPELGLGMVVEIGDDGRSVTVDFAAADVTRRYAVRSAPLRRVRFAPGDRIVGDDGSALSVDSVSERDGLFVYHCQGREVAETRVAPDVALGGARERLSAGRVDPPTEFALRVETARRLHAIRRSEVRGLCGARIELLPHQYYVAAEAAARRAPRVLLADETGLGKTIEACLTVNRLLLTGRAERVLILVPGSLIHQWLVELHRRFNLSFAIFDEERCEAVEATDNPFLSEQCVLAAIDLVAHDPVRAAQAADAGWDIVVVDEAHHLAWSPDCPSPEYEAVEQICQASEGLLLLTATPEQLGEEGHFARLRLLDPDRYSSLEAWREEAEGYRDTAAVAERLTDPAGEASESDLASLAAALDLDAETVKARARDDSGRRGLLAALIDRHGPGRVMFRNTRAVLPEMPLREAAFSSLTAAEPDSNLAACLRQEFDRMIETQASAERRSLQLPDEGRARPELDADDERVAWLVERLRREESSTKMLVICSSAAKAVAIKAAIEDRINVDIALFHEELTLVQRDRNAAWFAAPEGARLLVCSEIGSEGRNFQHARHLVMFDVPLDPDLIEQRIGRLDRIGQRGTVHIAVPTHRGSALEAVAMWQRDGAHAFERGSTVGQALLAHYGNRLVAVAAASAADPSPDGHAAVAELIDETSAMRDELGLRVESGRDRLLEMASLRKDTAEELISNVTGGDEDRPLEELFVRLLEHFRVYAEEIEPRTYRLDANAMQGSELPAVAEGRSTLTFDRATALVREDMGFVTADHPLLGDAMELLLASEAGNASFAVVEQPGPTRGETPALRLEAVFILESIAPGRLHIDRFLPPTPVVVATDSTLADCTDDLDSAIEGRLRRGAASWLVGQQAALRPVLAKMIDRCEHLASDRAESLRSSAQATLTSALGTELERLRSLACVNDAIRPEEIESVESELEGLRGYVAESRLRLDALRLTWMGASNDGVPLIGRQ